MRVAVITRYFPCSHEPWAGHSSYQTLKVLAQRCDVKVFYPESEYPPFLKPKSRSGRSLDYSYRPGGVDVEYIAYPALPAISRPLNGWFAARSILAKVRDWRPNIILNYIVYTDGDAARRARARSEDSLRRYPQSARTSIPSLRFVRASHAAFCATPTSPSPSPALC